MARGAQWPPHDTPDASPERDSADVADSLRRLSKSRLDRSYSCFELEHMPDHGAKQRPYRLLDRLRIGWSRNCLH